ncbi:MAG TPA: VOC family protein [Acidimicrobiales bacterium]|jgi:methylmalonyl-CoA/ethylmalonyl-CoA epimerase|nr:VOC family protein [Acidimicrobiales bacterium]
MTPPSLTTTVLDHVAHAVPAWQEAWPRYAGELGAEWSSGGEAIGFAPAQLRFANGARIELLRPHDTADNDFLSRFLERSGPGPHHLTFKVPDIRAALDAARHAGFDPIGVDFSDPEWQEAFIHPKQATGIVVQMAEAGSGWSSPPPDGFPTQRRPRRDGNGTVRPASLRRVTHAVADLDAGIELFGRLLGGTVEDRNARPGEEWIDFRWDCPLAVRLVAPTGGPESRELSAWLGDRSGRLHHLLFADEEPDTLMDAQRAGPGLPGLGGAVGDQNPWVIEPEHNLGLRLVAAQL